MQLCTCICGFFCSFNNSASLCGLDLHIMHALTEQQHKRGCISGWGGRSMHAVRTLLLALIPLVMYQQTIQMSNFTRIALLCAPYVHAVQLITSPLIQSEFPVPPSNVPSCSALYYKRLLLLPHNMPIFQYVSLKLSCISCPGNLSLLNSKIVPISYTFNYNDFKHVGNIIYSQ